VRTWPILFVLCAAALAHGQRVEVPVQPQISIRPTVAISHIRGYLADPIWARIPNAVITLQKKKAGVFVDVQSVESSPTGEFDFGKKSPGIYQLVTNVRGFCRITLPIRISEKGWPGLRIALPVSVTDTPSGYCDDRLKIERLEE
jgi:hypothetical protein